MKMIVSHGFSCLASLMIILLGLLIALNIFPNSLVEKVGIPSADSISRLHLLSDSQPSQNDRTLEVFLGSGDALHPWPKEFQGPSRRDSFSSRQQQGTCFGLTRSSRWNPRLSSHTFWKNTTFLASTSSHNFSDRFSSSLSNTSDLFISNFDGTTTDFVFINSITRRDDQYFSTPPSPSSPDPFFLLSSLIDPPSVEDFLWARNVTRSAKCSIYDQVLLIYPWVGVIDFITSFRDHLVFSPSPPKHNWVSILLWPQSSTLTQEDGLDSDRGVLIDSLSLFVLPLHLSNSKTRGRLKALVEVSDLVIGVAPPDLAVLASDMQTPFIVISPLLSQSLHSEHTSHHRSLFEPPCSEVDGNGTINPSYSLSCLLQFESGLATQQAMVEKTVTQVNKLLSPTHRLDILLHSYLNPSTGFGTSAMQMVEALDEMGLQVGFLPFQDPPPFAGWQSKSSVVRAVSLTKAKSEGGKGMIYSNRYLGYFIPHEREVLAVHRAARKAKYTVVYATFETTLAPTKWPALLNRYDAHLCSCREIRHSFLRSGLAIPSGVVPLAIDTKEWLFLNRSWPFEQELERRETDDSSQTFRFLMFADSEWLNHRKNYPLVVEAFRLAFENQSNVQLYLKLTHLSIDTLQARVQAPLNVRFFWRRLPISKLQVLVRKSHCFVFPSRGEGHGLPPREAMATGIPSIVAGFAGLEPIADPSISFPVPFTLTPAIGYEANRFHYEGGWNATFQTKNFGEWASIDPGDLALVMRQIYENQEEAKRRGLRAAEWIRRHENLQLLGERLQQSFPPT